MKNKFYAIGAIITAAGLLFVGCGVHKGQHHIQLGSGGSIDPRIGVTQGQLDRTNTSIDKVEASMQKLERLSQGPSKVSKQQVENIKSDVDRSYTEFADSLDNLEGSLTMARSTLRSRIARMDPKNPKDKASMEDLENTISRLDKYLIVTNQARRGVRQRSFKMLDALETAFLVSGYATGPWGIVGAVAFSFVRGLFGKRGRKQQRIKNHNTATS